MKKFPFIMLIVFGLLLGVSMMKRSPELPRKQPLRVGETSPSPRPAITMSRPNTTACTRDEECGKGFSCEATRWSGVACLEEDPSICPTPKIIQGVCRAAEGTICNQDSDCTAWSVCHRDATTRQTICAKRSLGSCNGPNDSSCPAGYFCDEDCGPPILYDSRFTEMTWSCRANELKGNPKDCPVCLAFGTFIDTPNGPIEIQNLRPGMPVWSLDRSGNRTVSVVGKTAVTKVPPGHHVVQLRLQDGRNIKVSPGHPTVIGLPVEALQPGDIYDGSSVLFTRLIHYGDTATYDILPESDTGYYWADGILFASTLAP